MIIEGNISVKAAILADHRIVDEIWIDDKKQQHKDVRFIIQQAHQKQIPIILKNRQQIDQVSQGKTHGGVIAFVQPRLYQSIQELQNAKFLVVLEGIVDPFNLGYIFRSLYAAGCDGVLMGEYDYHDQEVQITKASAGAFEYMPIVQSQHLRKDIQWLKKQGFTVYGAYRNQAVAYHQIQYPDQVILCIGGEMRGISKDVLLEVDQNIDIPYGRAYRNALNASSAASILAFEILRQKSIKS